MSSVCMCMCMQYCMQCVNVSDPRSLGIWGGLFCFLHFAFLFACYYYHFFLIESTRSWRPYLHCLAWYLGTQQAHSTCCLTQPEVTRSDHSTISLDPTLGVLCSLQLPQLPNTPHGMLFFGRTISNFIMECRTPGQQIQVKDPHIFQPMTS